MPLRMMLSLATTSLWWLAFAAAFAVSLAFPSAAASGQDCTNPLTQTDMNACSALKAQGAERRMNQTFARVRAKYATAPLAGELSAAQAAWLAFRAAECRYSADRYAGGSIQPLVRYSCFAQLTDARTNELAGYLREGG
ncbi:MAG: lysozyme inhibitor LprI family protein [Vulcanimicrobiaceae bacterium]